ncbi:insulin receptor isoform X1 [Drosophila pseudoobscura]|uniref:receptor protein-tyrosine kinase n=2 Tax=Drosophila pseudoobscura pseudoobscura TaxID=46245 RepID=A0A6I8UJB6_DROPS|nr:insulin receptor isoform X1 [Drosophila pseudoobscura]XP_033235846.1 insulin receptor isoform X1 [Drosophila pseudoobscura]
MWRSVRSQQNQQKEQHAENKNQNHSMGFGHNVVGLILLVLTVCCGVGVGAVAAAPGPEHECTSIDIRNECSKMHLLDNCTVVTGYVMITLIATHPYCNYSTYKFPKLKEITEFMIFTEVRGLTRVDEMFPNLTVIRGRRLFLNYALGVTNMPDLEYLEFPSLVAIQRGHVYIGNCPKLCQHEGVNWDLLTLSRGENHIMVGSSRCNTSVCRGCDSSYCWSTFKCQRSQNDNVAHYKVKVDYCHDECLGGCHQNGSATACQICRGISDEGVCVKRCPERKYLLEQYQRCYTQEECVKKHNHFTFVSQCVGFCPSGYRANEKNECMRCGPQEACISVCSPEPSSNAITIYNLGDAEELRGCQIVNGSLIITIRNQVNETQLVQSLTSIREIRGHLKVYRSSQLRSLKFLSNLERIHGDPLENRHYALILYDNKQLGELWKPESKLEFVEGGMFMHRNNKLCNKHMKEFQGVVTHDRSLDSLQTSDQEVLCSPSKLLLFVQKRTHRTVKLSWPKSQTSHELELVHRPLPPGVFYPEESELEAPVCIRINWQRRLLFPDELSENGTHYYFVLDKLEPDTRYACLLRTFGGDLSQEARSDLLYVQTERDIPQPPLLELVRKTDSSLTVRMKSHNHYHYMLTVYELEDDEAYIDSRDYCHQPSYLWQDMDGGQWRAFEDYDDCCAHQAEQADDHYFIAEMRKQYRCSLDNQDQCHDLDQEHAPLLRVQLPFNTSEYELRQLQRYRLYSLQLQACSDLGCSSHTTLNERTNYTLGADLLTQLTACRVPDSNKYILRFAEPVQPNGQVVSYVVHYRNNLSDSHMSCLTRLQHATAEYVYAAQLNVTFSECAVRVHSLAGDVLTPYVAITWCSEQEQILPHSRPTKQLNTSLGVSQVKTASSHSRGISIFLVCFLFGCSLSLMWILYKRRCWRKLPGLRRYVPVVQWLRERHHTEDREILVDGFETVRFQNNNNSSPDDYRM